MTCFIGNWWWELRNTLLVVDWGTFSVRLLRVYCTWEGVIVGLIGWGRFEVNFELTCFFCNVITVHI